MKLLPVALAIFYKFFDEKLHVWTQIRLDDGDYHGLLEFPGGKIEENESPLDAVVREVHEEVGIMLDPLAGKFMGIYPTAHKDKVILLNVFLFLDRPELSSKGSWLCIERDKLSSIYEGKIPGPNHEIIDDLFRSIYSDPRQT